MRSITAKTREVYAREVRGVHASIIVGETYARMWVNTLVSQLARRTAVRQRIFRDLTWLYGRTIHQASEALGVSHLKVTPHCFRHGGASTDGLFDVDLTTIQKRGRWSAKSSVKRYEKKGRILKQFERTPTKLLKQKGVEDQVLELSGRVLRPSARASSVLDCDVIVGRPTPKKKSRR